ncbi:MAG TPA: cysteine-rich CWC family protein [Usitatibacter sp.]|nr:cysteine-rich CWC family protein [Usitatibacter sp.]
MSGRDNLESPCISVCTLDAATQLCVGCLRTLEEIARWTEYSSAERAQIRAALPARREHLARAETPGRQEAGMQWRAQRCARCGAGFACGGEDRQSNCWCQSYPPLAPAPAVGASCLCPACLALAASD